MKEMHILWLVEQKQRYSIADLWRSYIMTLLNDPGDLAIDFLHYFEMGFFRTIRCPKDTVLIDHSRCQDDLNPNTATEMKGR